MNDGKKNEEKNIRIGGKFNKEWEIMKSGNIKWNDKNEIRLEWGYYGMENKEKVVKCNLLMNGEKGVIDVNLRENEFKGRFE